MKTISYDEWLKRSDIMGERARFILAFFDRAKLKRKKPSQLKVRPSKNAPRPPNH